MDLNQLQTFIAVCECGSFSGAAEKLGYSQSTVSFQMKQLESEFNTVLFNRIHHQTTITEHGGLVLANAKKIIALYDNTQHDLHGKEQVTGTVRVAISDSLSERYFTGDYVEFHKKFPGISVKMFHSGTSRMMELLQKNEVDIILTIDSRLYSPDLVICAESRESVHFACAADNPLSQCKNLTLADISSSPFALTGTEMSYRRHLDSSLGTQSLNITPQFETYNPDIICRIIKDCRALTFLPDFITEPYVKEGSLALLDVEGFECEVWSQMIVHKNKWISPPMQEFIKYFKEVMKKDWM